MTGLAEILAHVIHGVLVGGTVAAGLAVLFACLVSWDKSRTRRRHLQMGTNAAMRRLLKERDAAGIPSAVRRRR